MLINDGVQYVQKEDGQDGEINQVQDEDEEEDLVSG